MPHRFLHGFMNVGVLTLLVVGLLNIPAAGICAPADTIYCNSLKLNGGQFAMTGVLKKSIESANVGLYEPVVSVVTGTEEKQLSCSKVSASYNNHDISLGMECPGANLAVGQTLKVKWTVQTVQTYSTDAYYEEKQSSSIYGNRACWQDETKLVCEVEMEMTVPYAG